MNDTTVWSTDTVLKGGTVSPHNGNPVYPPNKIYADYYFQGWNSLNNQDVAEPGILENIQSDKTVYAAYKHGGSYEPV